MGGPVVTEVHVRPPEREGLGAPQHFLLPARPGIPCYHWAMVNGPNVKDIATGISVIADSASRRWTTRWAGRRADHRLMDGFLERGAPALVPRWRCRDHDPAQHHAGSRTGATTPAPVAGSRVAGSLRVPIGNQCRREHGGYLQTVAGGRRSHGLARDPGGSRPAELAPPSNRITEGFGDHRNPPQPHPPTVQRCSTTHPASIQFSR